MILIACSLCITLNINIDIINQPSTIGYIMFQEEFKNYGKDYVLLMLFLGNDYLPKLSNIDYNTLVICYEGYKKMYKKNIIIDEKIIYENLIFYFEYIIIYLKNNKNKKLIFSFKNINIDRFKIYYNNIGWCLKLYRLIKNENCYIMDTIGDKVINIYNFIYMRLI
jgi:5'-3' exonuclease